MADYQVNLELAIKGAKDLQRTRVETKRLQKEIDILNKRARLQFPATVKNFNNLSKEVGRAHRAVNEAAIGTDHYRAAIKNAVAVEEQFNKQLTTKQKLFKIERIAYKDGISFSQAKTKVIQQEIKAENELARRHDLTAIAMQFANSQQAYSREQKDRMGEQLAEFLMNLVI